MAQTREQMTPNLIQCSETLPVSDWWHKDENAQTTAWHEVLALSCPFSGKQTPTSDDEKWANEEGGEGISFRIKRFSKKHSQELISLWETAKEMLFAKNLHAAVPGAELQTLHGQNQCYKVLCSVVIKPPPLNTHTSLKLFALLPPSFALIFY